MIKVQMLRALVKQRLTAAAEEIFGLFERTIAEYEEELSRSKEENERQQKLLDAVFTPQLQLNIADVQQLSVVKEMVPPEQQEWRPSLDQEDPEPPHIKEKQEELWTSQEGEQLQGLEEADITKFRFSPVSVKREDDEEKPQSSQLHQRQTEQMEIKEIKGDGEDYGGSEPARNSDPDIQQLLMVKEEVPPEQQEWSSSLDQENPEPPPIKEEQEELWTSQEGEQLQGLKEADITKLPISPVSVKSEDDEEKPQSSQLHRRQLEQMEINADGEDCGGSEPAKNSDPGRHPEPDTDDKTGDTSEPETDNSEDWKETREPQSGLNSLNNDFSVSDSRCNTSEKPFSCSHCGKGFVYKGKMKVHMRIHTGEKPFSCSLCEKAFTFSGHLKTHMRSHTGEKTSSCSVCGKAFIDSGHLKKHMRVHTGEKPYSCSVCKKYFTQSGGLYTHMRIHTGEKPFSCSICFKAFSENGNLKKHMRIHTGEKLFSCSVCKKPFTHSGDLQRHIRIHTGEKPFICFICNKAFSRTGYLKAHMRSHKERNLSEPPANSLTVQMETEADGEDCGGEQARNSDPDRHPDPDIDDKTADSSESETDDSDDWMETREPQSGLNIE